MGKLCLSLMTYHTSLKLNNCVLTQTHFSQIPEEVVQQVVEEGTVMKCAGALMIENALLEPFIIRFDGTKDAIMGLPKNTALRLVGEAVKASKK